MLYPATSYLGWQLPILTDDVYGNANIVSIKTDKKVFRKSFSYCECIKKIFSSSQRNVQSTRIAMT